MDLPEPRTTGNGYPTFKWNSIGDTLAGTITSKAQVVNRPDLNDSSKMVEQIVFELHTDEPVSCRNQRGEVSEGQDWTVWIRTASQQYRVLYEAVKAQNGKLDVGARIAIKLVAFEDVKRPQPMKVYEVGFKPAPATVAAGSSVTDLI